jgi:hypothetical protein
MTAASLTPTLPRRVAVFGNAAAPQRPHATVSPAANAALERVFSAITDEAPEIAKPILDRALGAGAITPAEHAELRRELGDPTAPPEPAIAPVASVGAQRVLRQVFAAIRLASPAIAEPILDAAVAERAITPAQRHRVLERLRTSPARLLRPRAILSRS